MSSALGAECLKNGALGRVGGLHPGGKRQNPSRVHVAKVGASGATIPFEMKGSAVSALATRT